eukprot:8298878-Alexandrium_andersonii.AAC.1
MAKQKDDAARGAFLKKWFTPAEMSQLWGRLKTLRKNAKDPKTNEKWEEINKLPPREGKDTLKCQYLVDALVHPENWEQRVVTRIMSHSRKEERGYEAKG